MTPAPAFLPYGRQLIEEDDIAAVASVLAGDLLTTGPAVEAFEQALAANSGAPFAVACSSGTAALHMAALSLRLGPGDVVVVPSVTFVATANAARYVGAEVVFADVDADTGLMGPDHLDDALARVRDGLPRAVFPVHLNGQCADIEAIAARARTRGLAIVEDSCHALGGTQCVAEGDHAVGACAASDMTCFSFHPVKTVAMGEGGAVTTRDPALADALRLARSHGITRDPARFRVPEQAFDAEGAANPWYYEMAEPGFNYRASDINCALGTSQLAKLERFAAARSALVAAYDRALAPLAPLVRPVTRAGLGRPVWHLQVVLVDFAAAGIARARVMNRLRERGIGTQVHYLPVHRQPYYRDRYGLVDLPGADRYYARCLTLPLFVGMTEADVGHVVAELAAALGLQP